MDMHHLLQWIVVGVTVLVTGASVPAAEEGRHLELQKVLLSSGVELNYMERGKGIPVIFVHGTLGDYSVWDGQLGAFAKTYRVLAYSRRYNYPNSNKPRPNHSALVEAEDLFGFIKQLNLGKVHLIGHSYGGYTALCLALKHPELVLTLTLVEPPVVFAEGKIEEDKLSAMRRARAAFEKGDSEGAIRAVVDSSDPGKYDKIPESFRQLLLRNGGELRALVTSDDMYPPLDRAAIRKIAVPTLLLSGERSPVSLKSVSLELERLLPENGRRQIIIRNADHGMWFQRPDACRKAVLEFLKGK